MNHDTVIQNAFAMPHAASQISAIIGEHMASAARAEGHMPFVPSQGYAKSVAAMDNDELAVRIYEVLAGDPINIPRMCEALGVYRDRVRSQMDKLQLRGHLNKITMKRPGGGTDLNFYNLSEAGREFMERRAA